MQRLAVTLSAVSLAIAGIAGTAASARVGAPPPPFPRVPGAWWHAELNVTIKHKPHTLILDRGRIVQVSPTQLTLREKDGSTVTMPLNAQTLVVVDKLRAVPSDLRRKMSADTMRIDGGAAVRVRASSF